MPTEYNILLVEDSESDARFFRKLLEGDRSADYRVTHRDTLAKALEAAEMGRDADPRGENAHAEASSPLTGFLQ